MPVLPIKTETSKTFSIITKISMIGLGVSESIRSIYAHRNIKKSDYKSFKFGQS